MKTILAITLALSASLAAVAEEPSDHKPQDDQKSLQGDWIPTKADLSGKAGPKEFKSTEGEFLRNSHH